MKCSLVGSSCFFFVSFYFLYKVVLFPLLLFHVVEVKCEKPRGCQGEMYSHMVVDDFTLYLRFLIPIPALKITQDDQAST